MARVNVSHSRAAEALARTSPPPPLRAETNWPPTFVCSAILSPLPMVPLPFSFTILNCSQSFSQGAVTVRAPPPPFCAETHCPLPAFSVMKSPLTSEPPLRSDRVNVSQPFAHVLYAFSAAPPPLSATR